MRKPIALMVAMLWAAALPAQESINQFIDPSDGWFDASQWLIENPYGFLPVPVIITEPAIGTGLGIAGIYFHEPDSDAPPRSSGGFPVTDISAGFGGYTTNDSWLVGGYHFNTMRADKLRYTGFAGFGEFNLKFFGGDNLQLPGGVNFNVEGFLTQHDLKLRVADSNWFVGGRWAYTSVRNSFDVPISGIPTLVSDADTSGIGMVALYEEVNSQFSPTQGVTVDLSAIANRDAFGSDFKYDEYAAKLRGYQLYSDKYTLAARLDIKTTNGDVPFYALPYIELQGIPALRYQGATAGTIELRAGWQFHPRLRAMVFGGAGRTGDSLGDLGSAKSRTAIGTGLRYKVARLLGLEMGVDVARGPEDTHYYLVAGNAW